MPMRCRVLTDKGWVVLLWHFKSKLVSVQKGTRGTQHCSWNFKRQKFQVSKPNGFKGKMHLHHADLTNINTCSNTRRVTRSVTGHPLSQKQKSHLGGLVHLSSSTCCQRDQSSAPEYLPASPWGLQQQAQLQGPLSGLD